MLSGIIFESVELGDGESVYINDVYNWWHRMDVLLHLNGDPKIKLIQKLFYYRQKLIRKK